MKTKLVLLVAAIFLMSFTSLKKEHRGKDRKVNKIELVGETKNVNKANYEKFANDKFSKKRFGRNEAPMFNQKRFGRNEAPMFGQKRFGRNEVPMFGQKRFGHNEAPMFGQKRFGRNEAPMFNQKRFDRNSKHMIKRHNLKNKELSYFMNNSILLPEVTVYAEKI